jgi:hypothetical protein
LGQQAAADRLAVRRKRPRYILRFRRIDTSPRPSRSVPRSLTVAWASRPG